MALSEFELKRCERELEKFLSAKRPPVHIRKDLDLAYRLDKQSVILLEIRPEWQNPDNILESPFAKAMYVKSTGTWEIYWQGQDLKWHVYGPVPYVDRLEDFLSVVSEDKCGCFFG
jgi:hypothetical protein